MQKKTYKGKHGEESIARIQQLFTIASHKLYILFTLLKFV
jgi:hypothetical protein